MNLLAMREHSIKELFDKLNRRFSAPELIEFALSSLTEQNLQSDERFAAAFINMRQRQGKGSVLVRMELCERGVAAQLINELLNEADSVWFELAREVRHKRFKALPVDGREKARQIRFLHSRGFASRHIRAAFADTNDKE
jgi:regulatory protein